MELTFSQVKELCKQSGLRPTELDLDDWLIYTDNEADDKALELAYESLWAFNATYLFDNNYLIQACQTIQEQHCEDAQDAIIEMLGGRFKAEEIAQGGVMLDGRAHFLSSYDGNELELGNGVFAYRQN